MRKGKPMKIWIICTGAKEELRSGRCGAAAFQALARRGQEDPGEREEKKLPWTNGRVLLADTPAARKTAGICVEGGQLLIEPLLAPVIPAPWTDRGEHPLWLWREMARLQRGIGSPRQPESRRQLAARAEKLMERLTEEEKDCVLIADLCSPRGCWTGRGCGAIPGRGPAFSVISPGSGSCLPSGTCTAAAAGTTACCPIPAAGSGGTRLPARAADTRECEGSTSPAF